jgi:hypothetical protein
VTFRRVHADETGIAALWAAVILLFLIGATALAVDTSEFFQQARSQQRAVDLACLAGAAELPANPALAVEKAADFARPNQRGLHMITPGTPTTVVGNVSTWITGNFVLEVETPAEYNGVPNAAIMRVSLRQEAPTRFGKVLGADSSGILQEAFCGAFTSVSTGIFPVGVSAGFPGGIIKFTENQCNDEPSTASGSGVCNYLEVPRVDGLGGGGSNELTFNLMLGADRPITCYDALAGADDGCIPAPVRCDSVAGDVPCNQLVSKSGNIAGSVYAGLIGGNTATDHLGRLAYSDGRTPNPVNPHEMPSGVWTSVARPTGAPSGSVVWNTNLMSNPSDDLDTTCSPATSTTYFFDAGIPPAPNDPATPCYDGEIDDQPVYPIPPDITYENPPSFAISKYDCRDFRLIIVPAGDWGPKGAGPSNPRLFTITGFEVAYLLDPIVEDETSTSGGPPDGKREGTISGGDKRLLWWGHQNDTGGTWQEGDDRTTNLAQMSAFSVRFAPDANVVGGCPLNPVPPGLGDLLPSEVKLVAGP